MKKLSKTVLVLCALMLLLTGCTTLGKLFSSQPAVITPCKAPPALLIPPAHPNLSISIEAYLGSLVTAKEGGLGDTAIAQSLTKTLVLITRDVQGELSKLIELQGFQRDCAA